MKGAARIMIFGVVQGVGFRAFVIRCAEAQGLRGWVRNRRDGSVEALLIGEQAALEVAIGQCRRGPALARVARLERSPAEDDGTPDFVARMTV